MEYQDVCEVWAAQADGLIVWTVMTDNRDTEPEEGRAETKQVMEIF